MGPTRENRAAGPAHVRRSKVVATKETPGRRLGSPAVLALQRAAGNQAVCALLAGAAPLQRQPSGPAAKIPLDRGDVERGYFSRTKTVTYGVRAAGPAKPEGLWFDHLFETRAQADAYAKSLAAQGETAIRDVGALPRAWPAKTPGGLPVTGNAVVNVYVLEVPAGTPTISGVVRSQPESAATPGLPKSYPGGGPQVVVAAGTNAKVVGVFRVHGAITPPSHQLPPASPVSSGTGLTPTSLAKAKSLTPAVRGLLRQVIASGVLGQMARNVAKNLILALIVSLIIAWAHHRILEQQLGELEPVIRDRLAEALPMGLEKAIRHPTETVYVCVAIRITHASTVALDLRSRAEGPPKAPAEHVRVFFDLEKHDGELGSGFSGSYLVGERWTAYGQSVALDDLLGQVSPELRKQFTADRQAAQEAFYAEHPGARPLSSVSSTPREDPVASP